MERPKMIPVTRGKDLTGQKFGRLTVLYKTESIGKNAAWWCQCDCGNEKKIRADHLVGGITVSCGCLNKEIISQVKTNNLIGQVFGFLEVIDSTDKRTKSRHIIWKCLCKNCGEICYVSGDHLISGNTKSCGCIGNSIGEATIKELLNQYDISFMSQYKYDDCKDKLPLPFDFYVNDEYLIEFDGIQHFEVNEYFGGDEAFETQKHHDEIKNQYCRDHNIPLIRIPYTKLNTLSIEDLDLETTQYRVV